MFDDLALYRERFGEVLTYDSEGRVLTRTDAAGLTTAYTYVWPHKPQISTIQYPDGTYTIYTYDNTNGKPLQVYDASGKMLVYNYDWNNNPLSVTVYSGNSTAYEALVSGADTYTGSYVSQTADPFGNLTSYTYNQAKGLLTAMTDPAGTSTSYTYDADNDRLTKVETGDGRVQYGYTDGRLATLTHNTTAASSGDVTYTLIYDTYGTRTGVRVGSTDLVTYTYGAYNGDPVWTTYGNGQYSIKITGL